MLQLLRNNLGLSLNLILLAGGTFVSLLLGVIMARSGASLRPIYWFAGFFALVVVPQFIGHCFVAWQAAKADAPRAAAMKQIAGVTRDNYDTRRGDAETLFGPDADSQLVSDVRQAYGDAFANAELAQFAVLPNGDTVLLARFSGYTAAEKGWVNYLRVSGLNQLNGKGDSQRGYAVTRPAGDRAYVLHFGNMVGVWTGKDDEAIRSRMIAGGFEVPRRAPLEEVAASPTRAAVKSTSAARKTTSPLRVAFIGVAVAVYALIVVLYFFKGAAWAGTYRAQPGVTPVAASELAARLEAINQLDVPFQIERGSQPNEFFATWRYADAKWIDLARVRGLKRSLRVRLVVDEAAHKVRATDYVASYDWSAGRGGANLDWKAGIGLVLFQREQQRVLGLQLDEHGRFKPELSYTYKFNLEEMKAPLVAAVTRAGWNWRPTVWEGPTWLRWLTE